MLESLALKGFQRHRKFSVELDPRVTTFVGPSDRGKSTVLRALRWCLQNYQPQGANYLTWGEEVTCGELRLDGWRLIRKKGGGLNVYKLGEQKYKALRGEVPQDVARLAGVDDINFQGQLDPPFWFGDTAGKVSRELNRIINLEVIDTTLANAAAELRKRRAEREVCEARLNEALKRRRALSWVPEFQRAVRGLEKAQAELGLKRKRLEYMRESLIEMWRLEAAARLATPDFTKLDRLSQQVTECSRRLKELKALKKERDGLCQREAEAKRDLATLSEKIRNLTGDRCPLCESPINK